MNLRFGQRNKIHFQNENEFYDVLGYISNPNRNIYVSWETSSNRWGQEGRIWFGDISNAPDILTQSWSAGLNEYLRRLNCNEYLRFLVENYEYPSATRRLTNEDTRNIRRHVPSNYLNFFDAGLNR